jgi:hypothetical protein
MIAGFVGQMKDRFGDSGSAKAPITRFPNFEHLEARGRAGDGDADEDEGDHAETPGI